MTSVTLEQTRRGFYFAEYVTCLNGIVWREALRFLHQRERFVSALVRPLVWRFFFAAGFRQASCQRAVTERTQCGENAAGYPHR